MENVFLHLLNMSFTAAVLVVVVLLLRLVFHKAPRWIHCLLWALVAVRLLCPFTIESDLSLMPSAPVVTVPENLTLSEPVITPNTPSVDVIFPDTPSTPVPPQTNVGGTVTTPSTPTLPDSSVATPGDSVDPWQIALTVATYVWLLGALAMLVYAVATTVRLRLQVREAVRVQDNLWQCDHLRSPFILGVLRPRIYLPSDMDPTAQASVIAHEKAHLRRLDHLWKPLGFLLLAVYWFNPILWVAYIFLCRDIEAACDEQVVRNMTAADRKAYSEALLACSAPRRLVSACPLAFGETSVKSRIKSVLSYKKPTIWIIVAALLVSTVAGVCLLTDRPVAEQEPDDPPSVSDEDDTPDTAPVGKTIVVEAYSWMGEEGLRNLFGYLPESNPALSSTYGALPVKVLYSRAELDAVLRSLQDDRWQKMDFSAFDEAFFEENHLVMTYYKAGTGSAQPTVGAYVYTEEGTCLSVRLDVYKPYLCDAMLGEWLLFSGIQKADMTGVIKKEAYVEHIIPTDHFIAIFDEPSEQPTTTMEQWKEREFLSDAQSTALYALLRRLADENAWQKADSVDRAFTFVGCVNVGAADYYVPSDFSALLSEDGMLGWLTAQEAALISEWFPKTSEDVTPPSSDLTDVNAQVTGTVLSWNKEEEYVLLKVNPQYSEELGETLKVYTRYAPAGCAPEVGNALRVLYAGYVQEGFPNAIYAASLWNATTYSILETGVDLYDDLLKKIVDYCYGLAPSAEAPNCSYLIFREHLDPMFAIGIKVVDLDKNGQNDLLISAYNGFYGTRNYVYDAYTIKAGKLVHLLSSGERSQYYLHQDGYIEHQWSGGAALSGTDFYRLVDGTLTFVERVTYDGHYAVEIGLVDSLASITDTDGFWFHTTQVPGDSNEGYKHITAQQAKNIIDAFSAAHPPLNINFLQLEKGDSGSSTTTVPPTTTTTTTKPTTTAKPTTTTTTSPTKPEVTQTATVIFNCTINNKMTDRQIEKLFGASSVVSIDSSDALKAFHKTHINNGLPIFAEDYDAAFFEEHALLLTYHETASGMARPRAAVYTYSADGTVLSVAVDEFWPYNGLVTADIGEWIIVSVIKKTDLKGVTELTSHFRARVPDDSISFLVNPAVHPQNSAVKGSKAMTSFEGDVLHHILYSTMIDEEWGTWKPSPDVLFDVQLVLNGDTYYYDIDSGIIIATEGRTVYTMFWTACFTRLADRTNMIDWVLARYSDTNDEVWIWEDFEVNYYSNDARLLNTPEMRSIALRTNWAKNDSLNRTYDAQYTIGGALYFIDMEHEEILSEDEKQVSPMTKKEVEYLRSVLDADE